MTTHSWALALLLLSPLTTQAAAPPQGWWVVDKSPPESDMSPGTAVRFTTDEIEWILTGGDIDRWQTHLELLSDYFILRRGNVVGTLVRNGDGWVLGDTAPPAKGGVSLRAANSAESTRFDKTMSAAPDLASTCARAERCCQDAMAKMGTSCRLTEEFPPPPSLLSCQRFLQGIAVILQAKSTASPVSCSAPKSVTPSVERH